jgi:hypothetical protein
MPYACVGSSRGGSRGYPRQHRSELRARLRSSNDQTFDGAFFELYLHELLLLLGYALDVHAAVRSGDPGRPDFLAHRVDTEAFYLEARVAHDDSAAEAASKARVNQEYDTLDRPDSGDFYLDLEVDGAPSTPVPARRLRAAVAAFLQSLDYDACVRVFKGRGVVALPSETFTHEGWAVTYTALPKEHTRGEAHRDQATAQVESSTSVDDVRTLRSAVQRHAAKYGDLGLPYVIAVHAIGQRSGEPGSS